MSGQERLAEELAEKRLADSGQYISPVYGEHIALLREEVEAEAKWYADAVLAAGWRPPGTDTAREALDEAVTPLGAVHPADEAWPFGAEQAARLIAAVSWPNEREENRDGWAVRMLTDRPDLLDIEAPRARARLDSAIRCVRDRRTETGHAP